MKIILALLGYYSDYQDDKGYDLKNNNNSTGILSMKKK
jgi:hypothetical protein